MTRECTKCGRRFTPKPGPGRPRRRCEQCRPPELRRPDQAPLSTSENVEIPAETGLVATVTAELRAASRENSPEGAIALNLARMLAEGGHTASGAAALARELRATLEAATKDAPKRADSLDELAERRLRKVSGA